MKHHFGTTLCAMLLACAFTLCCVACGGSNGPTPKPPDPPTGTTALTGELNIFFNQQGYGRKWIDATVDLFKLFNPDLEINLIGEVYDQNGHNDIDTGDGVYDLVFSGSPLAQFAVPDANGKTKLLDITDVLETVQTDDTRSAAEKLAVYGLNDQFRYNGRYYTMPWMTTLCGLHYNETVLDGVFGKGEWEVPVTTNEMVELLDRLDEIESKKSAATRAYGLTISPEIAYWSYPATTWWAQYDGLAKFSEFFYAEFEEDGVRKVAKNADEFEKAMNPAGRLKGLEVVESILGNGKNINPVSVDIKFVDHQKQFATGTYQSARNPSAFISCGDWYELETAAAVQQAGEPIRFMRMPVISSIVETLDDKDMTDEELRAAIRAIDAGETPAGVSEADAARLLEARRTVCCGASNHVVGIPSSAPNVANAKAFLVFFASELGQEAFAQATGGLLPPYDYNFMQNEAVHKSEYVKSLYAAYYDAIDFLPAINEVKAPLYMFGGIGCFGSRLDIDERMSKGGVSASAYNTLILNELKGKYTTVSRYIAPTPRG